MPLPHWIEGRTAFWYRHDLADGWEYRLIDPEARTSEPAFDHHALAEALTGAGFADATPARLELDDLKIENGGAGLAFSYFGQGFTYKCESGALGRADRLAARPDLAVSPDGEKAVFIRDHNLWLLNLVSGDERPLTQDGERWFGYGAPTDSRANAALGGDGPIIPEGLWSADSSQFFTLRTDDRKLGAMPVVAFAPQDGSLRPSIIDKRYATPGDLNVPEMRFLIIDVATGAQTQAEWRPIPATRMYDGLFSLGLAWWGKDQQHAYFVDVDRGERRAKIIEIDVRTGDARPIFSETSETQLELGANVYGEANLRYLPDRHQLIWCSERTGRAHLYLIDLHIGELGACLSDGDWRVRDIIRVDEARGEVWFTVSERAGATCPTHIALARASLDGGAPILATPEHGEHAMVGAGDLDAMAYSYLGIDMSDVSSVSPDGRFIVDTCGTIDEMPKTVVRDRDGGVMISLAEAELGDLGFAFHPPRPFKALAGDGVTELHGAMFFPSDFSPDRSYPVLDYIYGGPQLSNVPNLMFSGLGNSSISTMVAAFAELGCVVIVMDGRGVALRDKAFQAHSYGQIQRASDIEDHVAVLRQLAERHAFLDLDRVGAYGISGGGYATAHAMFRYPDIFKVGVAAAGNYDQRLFWHSWGERYHGLATEVDYEGQAAKTHAAGLKGRLLLVHGLLDASCHPAGFFQLTQALMDANKDFDQIILPNAAHELDSYAIRRIWDFLMFHLIGETPPEDMQIRHGAEALIDKIRERMMRAAAAAAEQVEAND